MGESVGNMHKETLASDCLVYYFSFYILCRICLFWEIHNKMTVIYHYQPLYHLVNKGPLTFSLSFPPSLSGSQISVLVPPALGQAVSKAKSWSAMAFWLNCVWRPQAEKGAHAHYWRHRERKRSLHTCTWVTCTCTHTNKINRNITLIKIRVGHTGSMGIVRVTTENLCKIRLRESNVGVNWAKKLMQPL